MKKMGIDPAEIPSQGTYRVADEREPKAKRQKTGFNGVGKDDNSLDLQSNPTPILPRDCKHLLLDIEGCCTSISFVHDVLFPFALKNVRRYVDSLSEAEQDLLIKELSSDLTTAQIAQVEDVSDCASIVQYMVANDLKLASLKAMQGKIWKHGYESGDLKGHVYPDFVPMLNWMKS